MNYFNLYSPFTDQTITAAWNSQVKEAAMTPVLAEILLWRASELFPRFAACYAELQTMPRAARRALQYRIARSSELAAIIPESFQQCGRRVQHPLARSLAGAALLLALGQGVSTAATMIVTTNDPRINADGQCSLIEAIVNANADAPTHADCPAGSDADTIALPTEAQVSLTYALPVISSRITIEGNGAKLIRRGGPAFRLITNFGDLTLQNTTLSGGSSFRGGGLNNYGSLTIENSTISGNKVTTDGRYAFGGGIFNSGSLTIQNSIISKNKATGITSRCSPFDYYCNFFAGGGVFNFGGAVAIHNTTISGNRATFAGGGVHNCACYSENNNLTIINSTITGNMGGLGGGVSNRSVYLYDYDSNGIVTVRNSTVSNNRAELGGGVANYDTLIISRSLVSGNLASHASEISDYGVLTADDFNLFGSNGKAGITGFTPGVTDIVPGRGVGVGKILERLKSNGGPTKTHALKRGSPALDVIPFTDPSCAGKDQRGVDRPQGTSCDIGAFEREP